MNCSGVLSRPSLKKLSKFCVVYCPYIDLVFQSFINFEILGRTKTKQQKNTTPWATFLGVAGCHYAFTVWMNTILFCLLTRHVFLDNTSIKNSVEHSWETVLPEIHDGFA